MKVKRRKVLVMFILAVSLVLPGVSVPLIQEYDAIRGVNSVKVFFDVRDGVPESAAVHIKLIHETYKQFVSMQKKPVFVVVFMGSSVKLISSNQTEFGAEDRGYLKEIADTVSEMSKAGIQLEVCLAAVNYFRVDPASILSEIKQVGNGWVSQIGYQAKGYSLVPVY